MASDDDLTQIAPSAGIPNQLLRRNPKIFQEGYIFEVPDGEVISELLFQVLRSHRRIEAVGEPCIRLRFRFQPLAIALVIVQRVQESSQYSVLAYPLSKVPAQLVCCDDSPAEPIHSI